MLIGRIGTFRCENYGWNFCFGLWQWSANHLKLLNVFFTQQAISVSAMAALRISSLPSRSIISVSGSLLSRGKTSTLQEHVFLCHVILPTLSFRCSATIAPHFSVCCLIFGAIWDFSSHRTLPFSICSMGRTRKRKSKIGNGVINRKVRLVLIYWR